MKTKYEDVEERNEIKGKLRLIKKNNNNESLLNNILHARLCVAQFREEQK